MRLGKENIRVAVKAIATVWVWVIALWLGLLGYRYLGECFDVLTSATGPVVYKVTTPHGGITLKASALQFDSARNFIHLEGVEALGPDGNQIGRASSVSVQNVFPDNLLSRHETVMVELSGISGTLRRLKDGDLEIQDLLPKQSTEAGKVPFTVRLDSGIAKPAKITIVDLKGPKPFVRVARVSRFNLDGIGPRWLATGKIDVDGAGGANVEVRHDPDHGLSIEGVANHLDLAALSTQALVSETGTASTARTLHILRSLSARSLVVDGRVSIFMPRNGPFSLGADVAIDSDGFGYKDEFLADNAKFKGVITNSGLKGVLHANGQGVDLDYTGAYSWGNKSVVGGALDVKMADSVVAPNVLKRLLPHDATFTNGDFHGWLAYSGGGAIAVSGTGQAESIRYASEALDTPNFEVNATEQRVALKLVSANWNDTQVHGALNFEPKTKALDGVLQTDDQALAPLARRAGLRGLEGRGQIQAVVEGTANAPRFTLRAVGQVRFRQNGRTYNLGEAVANAAYSADQLSLSRLTVDGPNGAVTAKGTWDRKSNALDLDVVGDGMPLSVINSRFSGQAAFVGKVRGSARDPVADGRVEIYGAEFEQQKAPLILADVTANQRRLIASNVRAFRDSSAATGQLSLDFKTEALAGTGSADGIRLSDVLDKNIAGTVKVSNAVLGGTLKRVRLHGIIDGTNIVAKSLKVDSVKGEINLDGDDLRFLSMVAAFDKGDASAAGTYNLRTHEGDLNGKLEGVDLTDFAGAMPANTDLTGLLAGAFDAQINNSELTNVKLTGAAQNVSLNGFVLGAGPFSVADAGSGQWSGTLLLSGPNSRFDVENASYDQASKELQGNITAQGVSLKSLTRASLPYLASDSAPPEIRKNAVVVLPDQAMQQLYTLDGTLSGAASLGRQNASATLSLESLMLGGRASGSAQLNATRKDAVWNLQNLTWTGGLGNVAVSGSIAEKGDLNLQGTIKNLDPHWLALFEPTMDRLSGQSDVSFTATGPTKSPVIQSNLDYLEGGANDSNRHELKASATVRQGGIVASGTYFTNGISGPLTVNFPFEYPMTIPGDRPISGEISLPSTPLTSLAEAFPWLDAKRSVGNVSGSVQLQGSVDKLKLVGNAKLEADYLAAQNFQTALTHVKANADFNGNTLAIAASANGSNGGTMSLSKASVGLTNLSDLFGGSVNALLANTVQGQLNIDQLHLIQKGADPIDSVVVGDLYVNNTLKSPRIRGDINLVSGTLSLPSAPPQEKIELHPAVDPVFAVNLSIPNAINVKAGVGQFQLTGDGTLGGSLALLDLDMELVVDKGSVRLPNARIKIDPGGTVHLNYKSSPYGPPIESALVDLAGSTALTANPYGNTIQRYDVQLQMRGDLLVENGLQISAQADPPDLSQDSVLTLLGEGGFLLQQNTSAELVSPGQQLQNAAYTALPLLFDPFTQQVANGLGLDYFDFEYNAFEGLSVTGAKALGKNLVVSAQRQLSQPILGLPVAWDVRLSYRLPFKRNLRNLNLSFGANQLYPWRFALEYGWRF